MKKFKFGATMLAVLMCGSIGFAAGCSDDEGNMSEKQQKQQVYNNVVSSIETIATSGDIYHLGMTYEGTIREEDYEDGSYVTDEMTMNITMDGYFKGAEDAEDMQLDVEMSGSMRNNQGKSNVWMAAHLAEGYGYSAEIMKATKITTADKNEVLYDKEYVGDFMGGIGGMGGIVGMQGEAAIDLAAAYPGGTPNLGGGSASAKTEEEQIMEIAQKAATGVLAGMQSTVTRSGAKTTVTVNFKAEAESIYTVAGKIVDSIGRKTTVNDLLNNQDLKSFYNKYLGDITAAEIQTILLYAGADEFFDLEDVSTKGKSGYDYLVALITYVDEEGYLPESILDMKVSTLVDVSEIEEELEEARMVLDMVNELTASVSVTNNVLSGIAMSIDIVDLMDISYEFTLEKIADYEFVDVYELNVNPYDYQCDAEGCTNGAYDEDYRVDGKEYCYDHYKAKQTGYCDTCGSASVTRNEGGVESCDSCYYGWDNICDRCGTTGIYSWSGSEELCYDCYYNN